MKRTLFCALSITGLALGCAHQQHGVSRAEARAEHRAEARAQQTDTRAHDEADVAVVMPQHRAKGEHLASTGDTLPAASTSNTELNARDRGGDTLTPMDQGNNERDLDLTQRIRKALMADDSLSFTAKNAKIISRDGRVTLRGSVPTAAEKTSIAKAATSVAGVGHVTDELAVEAP